ncbi:MAG: amidase [Microthrixaceae bacterium]|nr:amidase [Microthrixaceae bacterium]
MSERAASDRAVSDRAASERVHAFTDDALGDDDAVALAERVRSGAVHPKELLEAAIARAAMVDPTLRAVETPMYDRPRTGAGSDAPFFGVPTYLKDNTEVLGVPTGNGSEAYVAKPAQKDAPFTGQVLSTGVTIIGKSRLPEFGLNASTEFMTREPTRNPWNPAYSVGASSGGSAALVAAGVVPIAHANDGGGSIRIPAACAGLVGLKTTRGRHLISDRMKKVPIDIGTEGIVSRSVRDTAVFLDGIEAGYRNPMLPPVGRIEGPGNRRLRVGVIFDSITGPPDADTRAAVEQTVAILEEAGHHVEEIPLPVGLGFRDDFLQYWALLAHALIDLGKHLVASDFDKTKADGVGRGLRDHHRANLRHTRGAIKRLKQVPAAYGEMFRGHELVVSPVLRHPAPEIGYLSPQLPFSTLIDRLFSYVAYTPLNNIAGTPAMSVPAGLSSTGLPVGVQLQGAWGDERTLIEAAYLLEQANPFPRITD